MSEVTLEREIQGADTQAMTPGAVLQEKREQAGFSVGYVAEQLRLTDNYVLYLERDEFEKLPAEPFVLGYYRAYARILNIPAEKLVSGYRDYRQQLDSTFEQVAGSRRVEKNSAKSSGPGGRFYLLVASVLAATWVTVSLLSQQDDTGPAAAASAIKSTASAVAMVEQKDTEVELSGAGASDLQVAESEVADSSTLNSTAALSQTAEALSHNTAALSQTTEALSQASASDQNIESTAVQLADAAAENPDEIVLASQPFSNGKQAMPLAPEKAPAAADAQVTANALDNLSIQFLDECWVEVTDSQGDVIAAELYQAGDSANLQGVAPFDVMFGNVRAISVEVNGKPVEVTPRASRKTLRMTINAS